VNFGWKVTEAKEESQLALSVLWKMYVECPQFSRDTLARSGMISAVELCLGWPVLVLNNNCV